MFSSQERTRGSRPWSSCLRIRTESFSRQLPKQQAVPPPSQSRCRRSWPSTKVCLQFPLDKTLWPGGGVRGILSPIYLPYQISTCLSQPHQHPQKGFSLALGMRSAKSDAAYRQKRPTWSSFCRKTAKSLKL